MNMRRSRGGHYAPNVPLSRRPLRPEPIEARWRIILVRSIRRGMLMRRLALPAAALVLCAATAVPVFAEVTRTLRIEVPSPTTTHWAIENLAGSMRVTRGAGPVVVAVATVHAESQELAGAMRFEQVTGDDGVPTWRVRYPLDRESTLRYPEGKGGSSIVSSLFGSLSGSSLKYDGHKVRVASND